MLKSRRPTASHLPAFMVGRRSNTDGRPSGSLWLTISPAGLWYTSTRGGFLLTRRWINLPLMRTWSLGRMRWPMWAGSPFTDTRPDMIRSSMSRREPRPASASTLCSFGASSSDVRSRRTAAFCTRPAPPSSLSNASEVTNEKTASASLSLPGAAWRPLPFLRLLPAFLPAPGTSLRGPRGRRGPDTRLPSASNTSATGAAACSAAGAAATASAACGASARGGWRSARSACTPRIWRGPRVGRASAGLSATTSGAASASAAAALAAARARGGRGAGAATASAAASAASATAFRAGLARVFLTAGAASVSAAATTGASAATSAFVRRFGLAATASPAAAAALAATASASIWALVRRLGLATMASSLAITVSGVFGLFILRFLAVLTWRSVNR